MVLVIWYYQVKEKNTPVFSICELWLNEQAAWKCKVRGHRHEERKKPWKSE